MAIDQSRRLHRRLLGSDSNTEMPETVRTTGKVAAVNSDGSVDLTIRANAMPIPDVPTDSNYVPQINDIVQVEITDGHPTVTGMEDSGGLPAALRTIALQVGAVAANEARGATAFGDLATAGPSVSITVGASGIAMVGIRATISTTSTNDGGSMGVALSGANTVGASDSLAWKPLVNAAILRCSSVFPLTSLSPGLTTFTAKYRDLIDTGTDVFFADRTIWAVSW